MLILIQAHADPDPGFPLLTSSTRLETNTEDKVKEDMETWTFQSAVPIVLSYEQCCRV
jgi:hypothetical protein